MAMDISAKTLKNDLIQMASLVEQSITLSLDASKSVEDVREIENQINQFHKKIDHACLTFLSLKQPQAKDLRTAVAALKINGELERMGDQAMTIKRFEKELGTINPKLFSMGELVSSMVKNCIDSLLYGDTTLARDVIGNDREINELYQHIMQNSFELIKTGQEKFENGHANIRIAKNLERIGDHATNIAEDVIFIESGTDIRHPELDKK